MKKSFFLLLIFLFFPIDSFANIEITEIMYDQEGTDTHSEWIEIYNSGADIDISQWHLYENDVHHGLTPDGFTILSSGERAVIVQNIDAMRLSLGNTLNLIKSSFSLNNTGEEIAISDADKLIQSSATYSSNDGASGNGYSLQKSGNNWIQAQPTPGKINTETDQSDTSTNIDTHTISEKKKSSFGNKKNIIKKQNFYTGFIEVLDQAVTRSDIRIKAYVTHTKDANVTKRIKGGVYFINFGDGSFAEQKERIDIVHSYEYPGNYELVFEFYPNRLAKDYDKEPEVVTRKKITVTDSRLEIIDIDTRGAIVLENTGDFDLDISTWNIQNVANQTFYIFPEYSTVYAGEKIHIPSKIHGLGMISHNSWINLRNDKNITLSSYTKNKNKLQQTRGVSHIATKKSPSSDIQKTPSVNKETQIDQTPLELFLEQHPNKELVDFGNHINDSDISPKSSEIPLVVIIVTGCIAFLLVGTRLLYKPENDDLDTNKVIGEIELIE